MDVDPSTMTATFTNIGIQCIKKCEMGRTNNRMDLNAVRLSFRAYYIDQNGNQQKCEPVISDKIHDKKAVADLVISELSACTGSAKGGDQIILLCEKVDFLGKIPKYILKSKIFAGVQRKYQNSVF